MKRLLTATVLILTVLNLSAIAKAENLEDLRQLLATKQCPRCDLSGSGLVLLNLTGANLSNANLSNANLSQANLTGADLSGANLVGASLHGANLTGANLAGANLAGADLREAYLSNATFTGTDLSKAYVQGAIGMPDTAGTPELFYSWGYNETKKGNYAAALANYNKAIALNAEYAPAYLGIAFALFRLGNEQGALQNGKIASKLFETQKNSSGYETAQAFVKNIESMQVAREQQRNNAQLDKIVQGVGSILLQLLLSY